MPIPEDPDLPEPDPEWIDEQRFGEVEPKQTKIRTRVLTPREFLPEIRLGADLQRVVDECSDLVSTRDGRLFSRSNEIVTVVGAPDFDPEAPPINPIALGTPIIRPMISASLTDRMTRHARFLKFKSKTDGWVEQIPPAPVVSALLSRGDWPKMRPLIGITESPIFRPDGTIRQEKGYDDATGFLFLPSCSFPEVSAHPTQDDAKRALAELAHVFCDFPYVDQSHAMVPVAAILTILARPAIDGPVPAFMFDASTRGSGKTLQADVVSRIALGRAAARKSYPEEDDELEKVLSAYALAGARIILLDNINRPIGGNALDLCLTSNEVELRVLGVSEIRRLLWLAVILGSGNNITMAEDTLRRVMVARLESPLENPESRTDFVHPNLAAWVRGERPRLVAAALTVLRAYHVVGRPSAGCPVWGSFESWSALIPNAIVYAGGADPMGARPKADAGMNDDLVALRVVHRELTRLDIAGHGLTVKQILAALYPTQREHDEAPDGWEDFREAIEQWCPTRPGTKPSGKTLGERLRKHAGRVLAGKRLAADTAHAGSRRWRVVSVAE